MPSEESTAASTPFLPGRTSVAVTATIGVQLLASAFMEISSEEHKRAIIAQLDTFATLAGAEDNETYLAAFADDATVLAPDRPAIEGKSAARAFYADAFREIETMRVIYHDPLVDIDGALAVRRYTATAQVTYKGSHKTVATRTKYLDVLRKELNGDWKIVVHMWSSNEDVQLKSPYDGR
jgi:ketosteroid isomerase-like protein